VVERHFLEQPQRGAQLLVDGRRGVVVENLLRQRVASERGCRDRGMGVGSKQALIQARHERGEQLTLGD
jgi:hypothetical protein